MSHYTHLSSNSSESHLQPQVPPSPTLRMLSSTEEEEEDVESQMYRSTGDDDATVPATPLVGTATNHARMGKDGGGMHIKLSSSSAPSSPKLGSSSSPLTSLTSSSSSSTTHPTSSPTSPTLLQRFIRHRFFTTLLAGIGFTCDAYDLFIMNLVIVLLKFEYNESSGEASLIADAVLAGSVIGQLSFGFIADQIGRRLGFICTLSLLTIGATLSSMSFRIGGFTIFQCLAICRFILGVGIGGEYPLAATVSAESDPSVVGRGRRVASVFSMQGVGCILAPLVILLLLGLSGPGNIAVVWRLALGIGALPGLGMLYFRWQMKESNVYVKEKERRKEEERRLEEENDVVSGGGSSSSSSSTTSFKSLLITITQALITRFHSLRAHTRDLLGTAGNWFLFDIIFYGQAFFSATIVSKWYKQPDHNDADAVHTYLLSTASATLLLGLCSLPGYWCATLGIDYFGRKRLQYIGYTGMALSYVLCGLLVGYLADYRLLFFFLYGLTFFFCNFGPNVTTFVIPSEIFPTKVRATAHGMSAAAGKAGAVLGGVIIPAILKHQQDTPSQVDPNKPPPSSSSSSPSPSADTSLSYVMFFCAAISILGWIWTYFFTRETQFMQLSQHPHEVVGGQQGGGSSEEDGMNGNGHSANGGEKLHNHDDAIDPEIEIQGRMMNGSTPRSPLMSPEEQMAEQAMQQEETSENSRMRTQMEI